MALTMILSVNRPLMDINGHATDVSGLKRKSSPSRMWVNQRFRCIFLYTDRTRISFFVIKQYWGRSKIFFSGRTAAYLLILHLSSLCKIWLAVRHVEFPQYQNTRFLSHTQEGCCNFLLSKLAVFSNPTALFSTSVKQLCSRDIWFKHRF